MFCNDAGNTYNLYEVIGIAQLSLSAVLKIVLNYQKFLTWYIYDCFNKESSTHKG